MRTIDKIDLIEASEDKRRRELADRFAALGTITGGIVHDLGNPLNVAINALAVVMREAFERNNRARALEAIALVNDALSQIETLAACVKAALYPGDGKPVEIADAISAAVKLADHEIRQRARLVLDVAPGALVTADRPRLVQVFLHVLMNAAQSIAEGAPQKNTINVSAKRDGRSIVVEISDTGRGIPASVLPRIFDPFYSTKPTGKGAGLGLFVSAELVRVLDGTIEARSAEGKGTTFRVTLPAHAPARAPMGSDPISVTLPRMKQNGSILIVDDDRECGEAMRDCIPRDRHHVDVIASPEYAFVQLRSRAYDLVFCDVNMPGMSGPELHAKACKLSGDVAARFVFVTGESTPLSYARQHRIEVLRKPFTADQVLAVIAARLGTDPGAKRA